MPFYKLVASRDMGKVPFTSPVEFLNYCIIYYLYFFISAIKELN